MLKLLRGTLKHWVARLLEWGCDKMEWMLNAIRYCLYDLIDWASQLHLDAHEDLGIDQYPSDEEDD